MTDSADTPPTYPFVRAVARHGKAAALGLALVVAAASVFWAVADGSVAILVVGLFVAVLLGIGMACASELMQIIAETLIPR